jgi:competence protein ComEC
MSGANIAIRVALPIRLATLWAAAVSWARALPETERGRFGIWLPVFMAAGVLAYLGLRSEPAAWAGAAASAAGIALTVLTWRQRPARACALAGLAAAIGFASGQLATVRAPATPLLPYRAVTLTGAVRGIDILPGGARRLLLEDVRLAADAPALPRLIRVRLRGNDEGPIGPGETVRVRALLRPAAPPAYPGAWDLQRDAYFSGLGGSGFALGLSENLGGARHTGASEWLRGLRDRIAARILAGSNPQDGPIAATLLTGNTTSIPDDDRAAFRNSGLAHLLAVAGLHIGIVMGLFLGLTRALLALSERAALHWPCKEIAALAALVAGGGYMLLTGAHIPIMRSFAMACLFTLAVVSGRRALSLRGLALAMTVILLLAPWEVAGVSFQMSFSAVLALIAGYEALREPLRRLRGEGSRHRRIASHVVALALTSVLAGTASAPFGAYHFGRIQSWFVLSNIFAVPVTAAWVMPWGLAALALIPLGLEHVALTPMGWGIEVILWIGRTASAMPEATWQVPHPPAWGLAATSIGIAWLGIWRTRWRLAGLAPLALGLLSPMMSAPPDLLVSPDARLIAMRTAEGAYVQLGNGAQDFVRTSFAQLWAVPDLAEFPASGTVGDVAACSATGCMLRPRADAMPVLLLRARPTSGACRGMALVIAAEPAEWWCGDDRPPLIDRFTVWREGAAAVWLRPDGARIVTDHDVRGDRPWVPVPTPRSARP